MQRIVPKQADGLLYSSAPKPVSGIIVFFQTAYDYPTTGAGMNKLAVFQIDAYMSHFLREVRLVKNTRSPSRKLRRDTFRLSSSWPEVLRGKRMW